MSYLDRWKAVRVAPPRTPSSSANNNRTTTEAAITTPTLLLDASSLRTDLGPSLHSASSTYNGCQTSPRKDLEDSSFLTGEPSLSTKIPDKLRKPVDHANITPSVSAVSRVETTSSTSVPAGAFSEDSCHSPSSTARKSRSRPLASPRPSEGFCNNCDKAILPEVLQQPGHFDETDAQKGQDRSDCECGEGFSSSAERKSHNCPAQKRKKHEMARQKLQSLFGKSGSHSPGNRETSSLDKPEAKTVDELNAELESYFQSSGRDKAARINTSRPSMILSGIGTRDAPIDLCDDEDEDVPMAPPTRREVSPRNVESNRSKTSLADVDVDVAKPAATRPSPDIDAILNEEVVASDATCSICSELIERASKDELDRHFRSSQHVSRLRDLGLYCPCEKQFLRLEDCKEHKCVHRDAVVQEKQRHADEMAKLRVLRVEDLQRQEAPPPRLDNDRQPTVASPVENRALGDLRIVQEEQNQKRVVDEQRCRSQVKITSRSVSLSTKPTPTASRCSSPLARARPDDFVSKRQATSLFDVNSGPSGANASSPYKSLEHARESKGQDALGLQAGLHNENPGSSRRPLATSPDVQTVRSDEGCQSAPAVQAELLQKEVSGHRPLAMSSVGQSARVMPNTSWEGERAKHARENIRQDCLQAALPQNEVFGQRPLAMNPDRLTALSGGCQSAPTNHCEERRNSAQVVAVEATNAFGSGQPRGNRHGFVPAVMASKGNRDPLVNVASSTDKQEKDGKTCGSSTSIGQDNAIDKSIISNHNKTAASQLSRDPMPSRDPRLSREQLGSSDYSPSCSSDRQSSTSTRSLASRNADPTEDHELWPSRNVDTSTFHKGPAEVAKLTKRKSIDYTLRFPDLPDSPGPSSVSGEEVTELEQSFGALACSQDNSEAATDINHPRSAPAQLVEKATDPRLGGGPPSVHHEKPSVSKINTDVPWFASGTTSSPNETPTVGKSSLPIHPPCVLPKKKVRKPSQSSLFNQTAAARQVRTPIVRRSSVNQGSPILPRSPTLEKSSVAKKCPLQPPNRHATLNNTAVPQEKQSPPTGSQAVNVARSPELAPRAPIQARPQAPAFASPASPPLPSPMMRDEYKQSDFHQDVQAQGPKPYVSEARRGGMPTTAAVIGLGISFPGSQAPIPPIPSGSMATSASELQHARRNAPVPPMYSPPIVPKWDENQLQLPSPTMQEAKLAQGIDTASAPKQSQGISERQKPFSKPSVPAPETTQKETLIPTGPRLAPRCDLKTAFGKESRSKNKSAEEYPELNHQHHRLRESWQKALTKLENAAKRRAASNYDKNRLSRFKELSKTDIHAAVVHAGFSVPPQWAQGPRRTAPTSRSRPRRPRIKSDKSWNLKTEQDRNKIRRMVATEDSNLRATWSTWPAEPGYVFIGSGDPFVTRHAKRTAKDRGAQVYKVFNKRKLMGIQVPETIADEVWNLESLTHDERQRAVEMKERKNRTDALLCLKGMFCNIPDNEAMKIISRAFRPYSKRIGRTETMKLPERLRIAVVAHIRHNHTNYTKLWDRRREHDANFFNKPESQQKVEIRSQVNGKLRGKWAEWQPSNVCRDPFKSIGTLQPKGFIEIGMDREKPNERRERQRQEKEDEDLRMENGLSSEDEEEEHGVGMSPDEEDEHGAGISRDEGNQAVQDLESLFEGPDTNDLDDTNEDNENTHQPDYVPFEAATGEGFAGATKHAADSDSESSLCPPRKKRRAALPSVEQSATPKSAPLPGIGGFQLPSSTTARCSGRKFFPKSKLFPTPSPSPELNTSQPARRNSTPARKRKRPSVPDSDSESEESENERKGLKSLAGRHRRMDTKEDSNLGLRGGALEDDVLDTIVVRPEATVENGRKKKARKNGGGKKHSEETQRTEVRVIDISSD